MNRGLLWLAASGLALGLAVLLALAARPTSERIEARVVSGICQQIVWQPDSPESVAGRVGAATAPPPPVRQRPFSGRLSINSTQPCTCRMAEPPATRLTAACLAARFRGDLSPTDPPVYARYRFFNITNLPDVRQGAKPALVSACGGGGGREATYTEPAAALGGAAAPVF